jgi:hypothetical protein
MRLQHRRGDRWRDAVGRDPDNVSALGGISVVSTAGISTLGAEFLGEGFALRLGRGSGSAQRARAVRSLCLCIENEKLFVAPRIFQRLVWSKKRTKVSNSFEKVSNSLACSHLSD